MFTHTDDAWAELLRKQRKRLEGKKYSGIVDNLDYESFEAMLEQMRSSFESSIVSRCIIKLKPVFQQLDIFERALSSLAQANSGASIVWGVLQMLLSSVCRFIQALEGLAQVLQQLTSTMTRVNRYIALLPSNDKLKYLSREIYDDYVHCCITAVKFYKKNALYNLLRFFSTDIYRKFKDVQDCIDSKITTFEKEARIDIDEILVNNTRRQPQKADPPTQIFSVPFSRNEYFCGRDDTLSEIHNILSPGLKFPPTSSSISPSGLQRSCLIHAMGGMGKTQVALAYAYRHREDYPYIFWLGAQKEPDLAVTFSNIATTIGIPNSESLGQGRRVNLVREWLETTEDRWLVIFDNLESIESIRPYWPSTSKGGAILVTSQMAGLSQVIRSHIALQPLTTEVGSTLLLDHLQLKSPSNTDRKAASTITELVGGLPIAVAHIAGSMFSSQLTLFEAIEMFEKQRLRSIWSTEKTWSTHMYDQRLNMVWDIALKELTQNAMHLIDILALLSPDAIPETMILGGEDTGTFPQGFSNVFTEIRSNLTKRQLVQRNTATSEPYLSLHRSLQLNLRDGLSTDQVKYHKVFKEAVSLVQRVFPVQHKTMSVENEKWVDYEKYQPHVQALQIVAQKSQQPIGELPSFAQLLGDAANYYWERGLLTIGVETCHFAVSIYESIPQPDLLAFSQPLTLWGLMALEMGISCREIGLRCFVRCLDLRAEYLSKAPGGGTRDEQLLYCNAWSDYSIALLEFGYYDEAERFINLNLALKSRNVTEKTYAMMFGISYGHLATIYASRRKYKEAKAFSARSVQMARVDYRPHSAALQKYLFFQANIWSDAGDLDKALASHQNILRERIEIFGPFGSHTRYSYYALGATHHKLGHLDAAENMLRSSLDALDQNPWLDEAVARSRFRLAQVLIEKGQFNESKTLRDLAERCRCELIVDAEDLFEGTVEDPISFYEHMVPVQCGRTMFGHAKVRPPDPSSLVIVPKALISLQNQRPDAYGLNGEDLILP